MEAMDSYNLFSLLSIRLLSHAKHLSMSVYNVLFEIMTERMAHQIVSGTHPPFDGRELIIHNAGEPVPTLDSICNHIGTI